MDKPLNVFVSSVQKETKPEREALRDYVRGDPLLGRFYELFLFEEHPAVGLRADEVYLKEVDKCDVYLGILANDYGPAGEDGLSATEREFNRATAKGKWRLAYVKGRDDSARDPRMLDLIRRAEQQLIRRRYVDASDLNAQVYASLVQHLESVGLITNLPFDAAACPRATLDDISEESVASFLALARRVRDYAVDPSTPTRDALAHLNLLDGDQPSRAAVLLFGKQPQRFLPSSEVKCLHFHGTEVRKPIPSYQIYHGTVFGLVDSAVDFIMSKIARAVGTRAAGPQAPVTYELPRDAVAEAVVNAVAHRDYSSNASIQVMLFADRLEVWNPGELPPGLTLERLRHPHASIPRNPLIADPLFLTRYVEKAGTGILDMIDLCRKAELPEPEFRQDGGQFVQTIWRDWLTAEVLNAAGLSERQRAAIAQMRTSVRFTNSEYQTVFQVAKRSAHRDLADLVEKGLVRRVGTTGKGTYYLLSNGATKGPKGPASSAAKGATKGPNRTRSAAGTKHGQRKSGRTSHFIRRGRRRQ